MKTTRLMALFRGPRLAASYFWVLAGLATLGLLVPLATAPSELSRFDLLSSGLLILLPGLAGWGLWRHGWAGWTWALITALAPILEIADGTHLYRLNLGLHWKLSLAGSPPDTGFGFGLGLADPAANSMMGSWVSVDLISLGVVILLIRQAWLDHRKGTK